MTMLLVNKTLHFKMCCIQKEKKKNASFCTKNEKLFAKKKLTFFRKKMLVYLILCVVQDFTNP